MRKCFKVNELAHVVEAIRISVVILLLLSPMIFTACKSGAHSGDKSPIMTCLADDKNWRCPSPAAVLTDKDLKVYGTSGNGQTVMLFVKSGDVGEFILGPQTADSAMFIPNKSQHSVRYSTHCGNGTGFVRVSSINDEDKTVSGDFYFTAYINNESKGRTISDGRFSNVRYQYFASPEEEQTNIFTYKMNGLATQIPHDRISVSRDDSLLTITAECPPSVRWEVVTIVMPSDLRAGAYDISPAGQVRASFKSDMAEPVFGSGSLSVIENNAAIRRFRATFAFNVTAANDVETHISDGELTVYF